MSKWWGRRNYQGKHRRPAEPESLQGPELHTLDDLSAVLESA